MQKRKLSSQEKVYKFCKKRDMIREVYKADDGTRSCIMDLSDLHKYIYKKNKETEKYTFADIVYDLERKGEISCFGCG